MNKPAAALEIDVPVVKDAKHGFYQLAQIPVEDDLSAYYESQYYDPLRRAPLHEDSEQAQRDLIAQSKDMAEDDRNWREQTEYADICTHLAELCGMGDSPHVLDVGAGIGELVGSMKARGFHTTGIEPSKEACLYAQKNGLNVVQHTVASWVTEKPQKVNAVTLLNVLEHVPHPRQALKYCRDMLVDDGIICVRVPNDFSAVQNAAVEKTGGPRWWIASPDHITYFSLESLCSFLTDCDFKVELASCDFPIDWFLLMGDNYLDSPEVGAQCHRRRKAFEMALPGPVRRQLYRSLASAGFGRNLVVYARKI